MGNKSRFKWQWAVCLAIGFLLGGIVGARYLAQTKTAQFVLGTFLPPHQKNWADPEYRQLTIGVEKSKVADILHLDRCDIICGASLEEFKSYRADRTGHTGISSAVLANIAEVWQVPRRRAGVTDFLLLGFDHSHRLCYKGIDEFMIGYQATRRGKT